MNSTAFHSTDISVCARLSDLPGLLATLAACARRYQCSEEDSKRLQLIVEELFVNTVTHGYQGSSDEPVTLTVSRTADSLYLRYTDHAPAFNPSQIQANPVSNTEIGGWGLELVRGLSRSLRHKCEAGQNIVDIEI